MSEDEVTEQDVDSASETPQEIPPVAQGGVSPEERLKAAAKKAQKLDKTGAAGVSDPENSKEVAKELPVNLNTMFGFSAQGRHTVTIGDKTVQIFPFRLKFELGHASQLTAKLHDVIVGASMTEAPSEGNGIVDYGALHALLSRFYRQDDELIPDEQLSMLMQGMMHSFDQEEHLDAIIELFQLATNREGEALTREELEAVLDIPTTIEFLRKIFNANIGMKARFLPLSGEN